MISITPNKRLMVYMFLWISFMIFNCSCTESKSECNCADPIDESHKGLQWLSSGPLGQHLAIDFVAPEGTEVRAIADGRIEHNYTNMGYYGGCDGTPGPVLITRHEGGTYGSYAVQYGHVSSDLKDNDLIFAGDVIGKVINYIPCCDSPEGCPHLHFAIWDSPAEHPTIGMGYGEPRSFVNPAWFFENNLCCPGTVTGAEADKPVFDSIDDAISYITQCVAADDYAKLTNACIGGRHNPAYIVKHQYVLDKLKGLNAEVPLEVLYSGSRFPEKEAEYKLGGHGKKWEHIHIDFIKKDGRWHLADIWDCK